MFAKPNNQKKINARKNQVKSKSSKSGLLSKLGLFKKKSKTKPFKRQSLKEIKSQHNNSKEVSKVFLQKNKSPQKTSAKWKKKERPKQKKLKNIGFVFFKIKNLTKPSVWVSIFKRFLILIHFKSWKKVIFGYLIIISILASALYISFWDRYFLVRDYEIELANSQGHRSYLSNEQIQSLVETWQQSKNLIFLPNNQYWYANEKSYLEIAKNLYPEITDIEIVQKSWPDTMKIRIYTKPVLATLRLEVDDRTYYLRIGDDGKVINFDKAEVKDSVISVQLKTTNTTEAELLAYDFSQNSIVYNRLWFIKSLREWFGENQKNIVGIEIPTPIDSDLVITFETGTKFYLNSQNIAWQNQIARLNFFYSYEKWQQENQQGLIKYVDFRINNKIFICYKDRGC